MNFIFVVFVNTKFALMMKQTLTNAPREHMLVTSMHVVQTHRVHTHANATVDIVGMEKLVLVS